MNSRPEATSLASLVQRISDDLAEADSGMLAELRRLQPDDPGSSTFWRIIVRYLDAEIPAATTAMRRCVAGL